MHGTILVALGGAIGASLRHLVNLAALRLFGPAFPWGTVAVNLAGCLAMGVFAGLLARRFDVPNEFRLFVATGILGGFTTFSAFSLDAAAGYVLASVAGSIAALFLGLWLARSLA
jgi:fluoride exporter